MASTFVAELETAIPDAGRLICGDVLDMWRLYKMAASQPETLSELVFYDTLSARDGLLFPDFFKAVHTFLREDGKEHRLASGRDLEVELEETFAAMHNNWSRYGPFFSRHPELRYLNRHSAFSFALQELADKLPSLRSLAAPLFWSLGEYYRTRSNLGAYVLLDEKLSNQPFIGTLFEREGGATPGEVRINLQPYGSQSGEITPYLHLLKHGDLIGFGRIALANVEGKTFVAVTSLQTDLLRKDSAMGVRNDLRLPTTFFPDVERNESSEYTVPSRLRKPYLGDYAWVHRIFDAVEASANSLSKTFGIEGIMVPTTSFEFSIGHRITVEGNYARGAYDVVAGERGYSKEHIKVKFPLTGGWGKGICWMNSIDNNKVAAP